MFWMFSASETLEPIPYVHVVWSQLSYNIPLQVNRTVQFNVYFEYSSGLDSSVPAQEKYSTVTMFL